MTIQHSAIPDGQIHEPKGSSTATSGQVYVSDGSGSGNWKRPDSTVLAGLSGDGSISGKAVLSDGTGNFKFGAAPTYGSLVINNNTNAFTCTAATDSSLNTNSDYQVLTSTGAPWSSEQLSNLTFTTDRLTTTTAGIYRIDVWANIASFPSTSAKVAFKHKITGSTFSTRHPMVTSNSSGGVANVGGFSIITLSANDYVQLAVSSTVAGSLVLSDVNVTLTLLAAT